MQTFVFDIDGTICTNTFGDYFKAKPFEEKILKINKLYEEGNLIKYFTARGSGTGKDWYEVTKQQLKLWGAKYHELIMGKPEGDFYVDDKGRNAYLWDWYDEVDQDNNLNFENIIKKDLVLSLNTLGKLLVEESLIKKIVKLSRLIQQSLESGGKIIFAGNGGSFADAQHLSAEFVSRFLTDRNPLPSIALATNSSTATAIGNDYGFENIFARELEAIACRKDIFIALLF